MMYWKKTGTYLFADGTEVDYFLFRDGVRLARLTHRPQTAEIYFGFTGQAKGQTRSCTTEELDFIVANPEIWWMEQQL